MPIVSVNLNPGYNGLNETHHYCPIPLSTVSASSSMSPSSSSLLSSGSARAKVRHPFPPLRRDFVVLYVQYIHVCAYTARFSKTYERDSSFDL